MWPGKLRFQFSPFVCLCVCSAFRLNHIIEFMNWALCVPLSVSECFCVVYACGWATYVWRMFWYVIQTISSPCVLFRLIAQFSKTPFFHWTNFAVVIYLFILSILRVFFSLLSEISCYCCHSFYHIWFVRRFENPDRIQKRQWRK